jgi:rhamnose transport system ATP-binding protein
MNAPMQSPVPQIPADDVPAVLEMRGISQIFPGVKALDNVSISLYPGKVTALIGENGAGKSTLVKILTGIYRPNEGEILVDGRLTTFSSAQAAIDAGVTAIHQETVLFDELTVAENIFLGHAPRTAWRTIDWKTMNSRARTLLESLESTIDPTIRLKDLSIAQRHLVAIARALSIEARIVIMDEPTAALSRKEIDDLFRIVEGLKTKGKAFSSSATSSTRSTRSPTTLPSFAMDARLVMGA